MSSPFIIITTIFLSLAALCRRHCRSRCLCRRRRFDDLRFALRLLTIKSHAAFLVSIITETKNTRSQNEAQIKKENERSEKKKKRRKKRQLLLFILFRHSCLSVFVDFFLCLTSLFPSVCVCTYECVCVC